MKIVFAGTPKCAVPALKIISENFTVCAVLTNPPAIIGRSKKLQDSDVSRTTKQLQKENRLSNDIPILTPHRLDDNFRTQLKSLKPDLLVCFAYGKIFDKQTMDIFPLGGINIHPSLLPELRGCAPVPYAIMSGATTTGISIQTIAEKTDSGDILAQKEIRIYEEDTSESLLNRCSKECCSLLCDTLKNFTEKLKNAKPQNEKLATYSHFIKKEDGLINWNNSAETIEKKIKAFTPWPGCFGYMNNEKINIIKAKIYKLKNKEHNQETPIGSIIGTDKEAGILVATGIGILAISELQKQGKKKLFWKDFLNGAKNFLDGTFRCK